MVTGRRHVNRNVRPERYSMTPDEFREIVLPQIVTAWNDNCFCANPIFQKLLSFNFRDYGIGPAALADSEILIDALIRQRFTQQHEPKSHQGEITQVYKCSQCQATCTELYAEFSISMYQSMVTYDQNPTLAPSGLYLVGFYGFKQNEFGKISDFQQASTPDDFIRQLKAE